MAAETGRSACPDRPEPIIDVLDASPPLASLVGKAAARSSSRIALTVRAREAVTIRAETPSNVPHTDAAGTQRLHAKRFLGAEDASTSVGTTVTRRTTSDAAGTRWSFVGAEMAHGPQAFSGVRDVRSVTLRSCAGYDRASGLERTTDSPTLRLRFAPRPVASDRAARDD